MSYRVSKTSILTTAGKKPLLHRDQYWLPISLTMLYVWSSRAINVCGLSAINYHAGVDWVDSLIVEKAPTWMYARVRSRNLFFFNTQASSLIK